jgi:hypothetical protein
MEQDTLLAIAGIVVSIFLFLIGYRSTIGAKKERVRAANKEIIESLLKRLVLEDFSPRLNEIDRFAAGKAIDYLLKANNVLTTDQIIDILYARVLDNDLIGPEQRRKIVNRLRALSEGEPQSEEVLVIPETVTGEPSRQERTKSLIGVLGFASSMIASLMVFFLDVTFSGKALSFSKTDLMPVMATFLASLGIIIPIILIKRLKDSQEETRPTVTEEYHSDVEHEIAKLMKKMGISFEHMRRGPYDFRIDGKDGVYLVELKQSLTKAPSAFIGNLINRLESIALDTNATSSLLVSLEPVPQKFKDMEGKHVKIFDIEGFKQFLRDLQNK